MAPTLGKSEAHYRTAVTASRRCGVCTMYRRGSSYGRCTLVKGLIDPDYVCKYFEPRVRDDGEE